MRHPWWIEDRDALKLIWRVFQKTATVVFGVGAILAVMVGTIALADWLSPPSLDVIPISVLIFWLLVIVCVIATAIASEDRLHDYKRRMQSSDRWRDSE